MTDTIAPRPPCSRRVDIYAEDAALQLIEQHIPPAAWFAAIGYITQYMLATRPHVIVYVVASEGLPEIHAGFREQPDAAPFTLHGLWDVQAQRFRFHS